MSDKAEPAKDGRREQADVNSLSPGDIARMSAEEAAAALKKLIQGRPTQVDLERLGQLSPPHTPSRER